ncbi:hypothetical protein SEPCBS57363_005531 [Sporothrix epigloea]|uniref:Uncharacterized protein n=1 Tax=Sporothrix epigloea TaxID=1892477 RepID=A0ABP0DY36_9PEZI
MISPVDSRRTSDDHDVPSTASHRQSLPSLKDVIGKNSSATYHHASSHPPPSASSAAPPVQQSSLPTPFTTSATPRPFSSEPLSDMQQHHNRHSMRRCTRHTCHNNHLTFRINNALETSHPTTITRPHLPTSQRPLPTPPPNQSHISYPGSPRLSGPPSLPSSFESHAPAMQESPVDYNRPQSRYDQTLFRHFESWNYTEYLARIGSNSRTIYNFAEAFASLAREEHGPHPMPGRMPSEREVLEMISNAEWLKTMLESLRHTVHEVNEGRTSDGGNGKGDSTGSGTGNSGRQKTDIDMPIYNDQASKTYGPEVKKRRGPRHLDDATAATASTPPNGVVGPTVPARFAMLVVYIMRSSSEKSSSKPGGFGPSTQIPGYDEYIELRNKNIGR